MSHRAEPSKTTTGTAAGRGRSEGVTLACAVSAAVALGVAFGTWVTARLTPPRLAGAMTPTRLLPEASAYAPAARPSPCVGCETSPSGEATPAPGPDGKADEEELATTSGVTKGDAREAAPASVASPRRAEEVAAAGAEPHGVTNSESVAAPGPDPSRPVAWKVGSSPKAVARVNARRDGGKAADGAVRAQSVPCAPYASASSLSLRLGGAAPLILGGPGAGVRVNVTTPDWAHIAVIYEGPAGHNGWLRYSVRSVGRRPGLYTVRFSTPCGSQNIPVTVK